MADILDFTPKQAKQTKEISVMSMQCPLCNGVKFYLCEKQFDGQFSFCCASCESFYVGISLAQDG